jgi:hypothetical protein
MKLKSTLETVNSVATLSRMLEAARIQDKSEKTKKIIRARLVELTDDAVISPAEMAGVSN